MSGCIKINIRVIKKLYKLIILSFVFMIGFLLITYLNGGINETTFLMMVGGYLPLYKLLDISFFLMMNSVLIYIAIYLLKYDFKRPEVFLRVESNKKWFLAKICVLLMFNLLFAFAVVLIFQSTFIILNQILFDLSISTVIILFLKNLSLQILTIGLFYGEVKNGNSC